jgi:esterase/lipase superfamily enzyme
MDELTTRRSHWCTAFLCSPPVMRGIARGQAGLGLVMALVLLGATSSGCSRSEEQERVAESSSAAERVPEGQPSSQSLPVDSVPPEHTAREIAPLFRWTDGEPLLHLPAHDASVPADGPIAGRTAEAPVDQRARSVHPDREERFTTIRVFYGTNRRSTGSDDPKAMYGTTGGDVSYGFCDVSIPPDHQEGELESPSIWRLEFREDPARHVVLMRVQPRSRDRFVCELQQKVWSSMEVIDTPGGPALAGGEVLVFVHGYNNSFEDAARRTAQIAYDLKFRGAPVMYSWPSQARATLEGYRTDGQMAGWSEEHLVEFVATLAEQSGARRVHLIAHSMGNRIVAGALRRLVEQNPAGRIPRFNEVILSAPDVDAEYFKRAIAPRIVHAADRITIYSSSRDYALKMSRFFNPRARRRLGEGGENLTVFPEHDNIDVVDATDVETDLFALNHSYHADSPTVLSDMKLLMQGYSTQQRGLAALLDRVGWQIRGTARRMGEATFPPRR